MNKLCAVVFLAALALARAAPAINDGKNRIVGGSDAAPGEFPYQVSLRTASGLHFCGGCIINYRTIVTVASCVIGRPASDVRIVAGSIYLNSGGVTFTVSRITMHASYVPSTRTSDVAVVIASAAIAFTPIIQPLPLLTAAIGDGVTARFSGWGNTSYPGYPSNTLQKTTLTTITVAQCQSSLSEIGPIYDTHICTFTKVGQGACDGDFGGPLEVGGGLVGIGSWVSPCAKGYPDVFTRISSFAAWINSNIES